jgi:hypothetical protein
MSFFGTCGQISTFLQLVTKNRLNVVPWFGDWYLTGFDYNKDLPTKNLKDKYNSKVISWSSKGLLKVEYLGTIFQIYSKKMPYKGECLRNEGRFTTKEKVKMKDMVADIIAVDKEGERISHPFTTVEQMLMNGGEEERGGIDKYY